LVCITPKTYKGYVAWVFHVIVMVGGKKYVKTKIHETENVGVKDWVGGEIFKDIRMAFKWLFASG